LTGIALLQKTKKKKWKKYAKKDMKDMAKWAEESPVNCSHKLLLLQAEMAALKGWKSSARKLFDSAVESASKSGFINEEALSYERAAIFFSRNGDGPSASRYFARAHALYVHWGATAKADRLHQEFSSMVITARRRESFKVFLRGRVRPQI